MTRRRTWGQWWRDWYAGISPTPQRRRVLCLRVVDVSGAPIVGPVDADEFARIIRYGGYGDGWIPLWVLMGSPVDARTLLPPAGLDGFSIQFHVEER